MINEEKQQYITNTIFLNEEVRFLKPLPYKILLLYYATGQFHII